MHTIVRDAIAVGTVKCGLSGANRAKSGGSGVDTALRPADVGLMFTLPPCRANLKPEGILRPPARSSIGTVYQVARRQKIPVAHNAPEREFTSGCRGFCRARATAARFSGHQVSGSRRTKVKSCPIQ